MKLDYYKDIGKYNNILHLSKLEILFCISYFFIALIICIYSIPRGSLFSQDSIEYVIAAEKLYRDHNLFLMSIQPIYPILIATGIGLGITSEQSASIIPIISYAILGFPLFLLSKIISRPIAGYLTCAICLLCGKYLLFMSAHAWTEMPYLLFSVIAVLFLAIYNKYGYMSSITFAGIFTLLASLTRYIGVTLILAGLVSIAVNNRGIKKSIISLANYCLIAVIPFTIWVSNIIWTSASHTVYFLSTSPSNPPFKEMLYKFLIIAIGIFYIDYEPTIFVISLVFIFAIIYLCLHKGLIVFIKNTIPLTSYILIYSIMLILMTSSFWISVEGGILDTRKAIQIFPYVILLIVSLFIYVYNNISSKFLKVAFKSFSLVLLICLVAQGTDLLYFDANTIATESIAEYASRDRLNFYILQNNITADDRIYIDASAFNRANFLMYLHSRHPHIVASAIENSIPGATVLDNLTLRDNISSTLNSLADLIKDNKNHPIYLIVPLPVSHSYSKCSSKDICLMNPYALQPDVICKVDLKDIESCCREEYSVNDNTSAVSLAIEYMDRSSIMQLANTNVPIENIFDNTNTFGVQNAPHNSTNFTISYPCNILQIQTYHWNNGAGKSAGTIGLQDQKGQIYGPWPAKGKIGSGGVRNAYWVVSPDGGINLSPRTYTIIDSDPTSWSCNGESDYEGITAIWGINSSLSSKGKTMINI